MKKLKKKIYILIVIQISIFHSCNISNEKNEGWLKGNKKEIVEKIENQFGGFDQTMIEVNYRYHQIFKAGTDNNWEYAAYQLEEMMECLEKGFIRRPERKVSAEHFINLNLPDLKESINSNNFENFTNSFKSLTIACNNCHVKESVEFIRIKIPEINSGSINF